jgi:hypothetical protein
MGYRQANHINIRNRMSWEERHIQSTHWHPVARLLDAWVDYAVGHERRYHSKLAEDYILGKEWKTIGLALIDLLNGDLGDMDAGSLWSTIAHNLKEAGFHIPELHGEEDDV